MTSNISNASSGFASTYGSGGELLVVVAGVLAIVLAIALVNSTAFRWLVNRFSTLAAAVYYAVHGVAGLAVLAGFVYPFYLVGQLDGETQATIALYAVGAVAAFVALSGFGYVVRHYFVEPVLSNAEDAGLIDTETEDVEVSD